jgi:hypothetical protein
MREDGCWEKYAAHLKEWYATTYRAREGATKAINNGRLIRKIVYEYKGTTTYDRLKSGGVSEYAAKTIIVYMRNTQESYMSRCISETGGFSPDVACMSDSDCPRGYRCRGVGKDSECIEEGEADDSPKIGLPKLPDIKLPSAPSLGGSAKIIGFFIILIALLIALGYSGMGGAAGSHLEK